MMKRKEMAKAVIDMMKAYDIDYGDVRIVEEIHEDIHVKNDTVESMNNVRSFGFGVRVFYRGFWGFASSSDVSLESFDKAIKLAYEIAKHSYLVGGKGLRLSEEEVHVDDYKTPIKKDPFKIPLQDKLNLLFEVYEIARKFDKVKIVESALSFTKIEKVFASTEGALISQEIYQTGGGYSIYAIDDDIQVRSYPASHRGDFGTGGYELIEEWDFISHVERVADEAVRLLKAPPLPAGEYDLVIGTHQMALQIHESVGHPLELDRVYGYEAGYAGTSWANELGLKYGSKYMNIVQDATVPKGLGSFGYDDDGVKAKREFLIKEGILVNYLSSRDSAPLIGKKSTGASRASSWDRMPIVRMTNVNLLPGDMELDELISDVKDGFFIDTNRSWSIDQRRLNFQFATEIAYRIKNGKLLKDEIYKNPIYYDITPKFWSKLDGVANEKYWKIWGVPNCGKGEPGQTARVGHGSSPARFRNVKMGSVR